MPDTPRRDFLRRSTFGLVGLGAGVLTLRADARPTPDCGDPADHARFFDGVDDPPPITLPDEAPVTRSSQQGPFYRAGAPYRAKVSPPLAEGVCLVVMGRVWSHGTKKPIPNAAIDVWHADVKGEYDNADGSFRNRARLICNEAGGYEFETIHPAGYRGGPDFQRSPHIHFKVSAPGHRAITSEMFFEGDPHQDIDPLFRHELVVKMACKETARGAIEFGVFDMVLSPA